MSISDFIKENKGLFIYYPIAILAAALGIVVAVCVLFNSDKTANIIYSDEYRSATITVGDEQTEEETGLGEGEEAVIEDIPTVEEVNNETPDVDIDAGEGVSLLKEDCPEGEECGLGAFIYAPTETITAFKNYVLGKCWNTDNAYGGQCWDLADLFFQNYAGYRAQTCGTGAAKGMVYDGCWQKNATDKFEMIWDPNSLQAGDVVVFGNGTYGHVGFALGKPNNGYITLLGQNQGGEVCDGGGSSANIININLKNFTGAFRPKAYIKVEPIPTPDPEPTPISPVDEKDVYIVKKGDTLGAVTRNFCGYTGSALFGDNGAAQKVAEFNGITNRGLIYPKQQIRCPSF